MYHNVECHYAECCNLFIAVLNAITLSVVMLNVIMMSVMALFLSLARISSVT
jgi:hypothetical protein